MKNKDAAEKQSGPLMSFVIKLLMLEAMRCYHNDDYVGMQYVERVMSNIYSKWDPDVKS